MAGGRIAGLGLAAAAATLWAIGGIAAQELFSRYGVSPAWLVAVRLSAGGLLLLAVFRPPWPRGHAVRLIAVATIGIAGTQFTWFEAIRHSNVALATFVQYSAVAMTAAWQMTFRQVRPTMARIAAVAAAGTGVWLLAVGSGGLGASRSVVTGIVLALTSAVTYSFYLLTSVRLVQDIGARSATAWGLTIGSVPMLVWAPPWTIRPAGNPVALAALAAVVAVGATAVAFSLSLASLRHITPTEFAVTSTLEPALAAAIAAVVLGVTLRVPQYAGGALTVVAVLLLAPQRG